MGHSEELSDTPENLEGGEYMQGCACMCETVHTWSREAWECPHHSPLAGVKALHKKEVRVKTVLNCDRSQTLGHKLYDSIYMKWREQANPYREKNSGCLGLGEGWNEEWLLMVYAVTFWGDEKCSGIR